jgi:hypothetical protein
LTQSHDRGRATRGTALPARISRTSPPAPRGGRRPEEQCWGAGRRGGEKWGDRDPAGLPARPTAHSWSAAVPGNQAVASVYSAPTAYRRCCRALHSLNALTLITLCIAPHFTGKDPEAQRSWVRCRGHTANWLVQSRCKCSVLGMQLSGRASAGQAQGPPGCHPRSARKKKKKKEGRKDSTPC